MITKQDEENEVMKEIAEGICDICQIDDDDTQTFYEVLDYLIENVRLI